MPQKETRPKIAKSLGQKNVYTPTALVRTISSVLRNHQKHPAQVTLSGPSKLTISKRAHRQLRPLSAPRPTQCPMLPIPFAQITPLLSYHLPRLRLFPVLCIQEKGRVELKRQDRPVNGQNYRRIRVMKRRAGLIFT